MAPSFFLKSFDMLITIAYEFCMIFDIVFSSNTILVYTNCYLVSLFVYIKNDDLSILHQLAPKNQILPLHFGCLLILQLKSDDHLDLLLSHAVQKLLP